MPLGPASYRSIGQPSNALTSSRCSGNYLKVTLTLLPEFLFDKLWSTQERGCVSQEVLNKLGCGNNDPQISKQSLYLTHSLYTSIKSQLQLCSKTSSLRVPAAGAAPVWNIADLTADREEDIVCTVFNVSAWLLTLYWLRQVTQSACI